MLWLDGEPLPRRNWKLSGRATCVEHPDAGEGGGELRKRKYDQALLVLPHDGDAHHGPIHKTYKDHFQDAGFEVDLIPNQGPGAAMMIESAKAASLLIAAPSSTTRMLSHLESRPVGNLAGTR
jgi:hypothetical protein